MGRARRIVAVVGASVLLASAVAAGAHAEGRSAAKINKNGILVLGADLQLSRTHFDLTKVEVAGASYQTWIYGALLRITPSGKIIPDLAKSVTVVDPSTIKVVLKPNLKFTDGTPVNAAAFKFTIEYQIAHDLTTGPEQEFRQVDTVTVDSDLEFTVKLKTPIAGAEYRLMRLCELGCPISPTAVQNGVDFEKNPVGAGPFKLQSFTDGVQFTLVKNPAYWDAKHVKLGGIQYKHVTMTSQVNALQAGDIDYGFISLAQADELASSKNLKATTKATDNSLLQGHICKNRPPFDNIKVRQAVNYATDRDQLNQLLYNGTGEPMWGFFKSDSINYDKTLKNYYKTDINKAKQLLTEAGYPNGITFDVYFTPGNTDSEKGSQIVQQQWIKAGITINLKPLTSQGDFFPNATGGPPMYFFALQRSGAPKVTRVYVSGFGNVCNWVDPTLNDLMTKIQGLPENSPQAASLWKQASKEGLDTAVTIFGDFGTQTWVINTNKIGGAQASESRAGTPEPYVWGMYVKK